MMQSSCGRAANVLMGTPTASRGRQESMKKHRRLAETCCQSANGHQSNMTQEEPISFDFEALL